MGYYLKCRWDNGKADWVWGFFGPKAHYDKEGNWVGGGGTIDGFIAEGDREWAKRMSYHYQIPMPEPTE